MEGARASGRAREGETGKPTRGRKSDIGGGRTMKTRESERESVRIYIRDGTYV